MIINFKPTIICSYCDDEIPKNKSVIAIGGLGQTRVCEDCAIEYDGNTYSLECCVACESCGDYIPGTETIDGYCSNCYNDGDEDDE
jgi:hypothetical protein